LAGSFLKCFHKLFKEIITNNNNMKGLYHHLREAWKKPDEKRLREEFASFQFRAQTEPGFETLDAWAEYFASYDRPNSDFVRLMDLYKKSWEELKPYKGVKSTITDLRKKGIDFIVLTDTGSPSQVMEKRWRYDFGLNLTGILSSKDLGVTKPAKKFFDTALNRYGLNQDEVVFLAHDLDELEGAHDLGYTVFSLNLNNEDDFSFIPEERKLDNFSDLKYAVRPWKNDE